MEIKIKDLFNDISHYATPFIWAEIEPEPVTYPAIEGNTSNFITDYQNDYTLFDHYFITHYGDRTVSLDVDEEHVEEYWQETMYSILRIYLDAWARLYYALNIDYNPIYNVEEHTTTTYGSHDTDTKYAQDQTTDSFGEHQTTNSIGQKETTNGTRTDYTTDYSVSFDAATEKETGKTEDTIGAQTITEGAHTDTITNAAATDTHTRAGRTDTVTSKQHIDTVDRAGNIGVVSATQLLAEEEKLRRKQSFYNNCFLTIVEELGAYYECDFVL